ncbi:hypothetical protein PRK78_005184 [Emydomyces testavorans]|uniref:Uncharacterized protein n=1 Tax=Emydomyces testavorans TaxID=2070801 RepID=A0AAF0DK08_9EURO|nr:hypothetical protein PRK78_005184 [Emydomyces testavorans]
MANKTPTTTPGKNPAATAPPGKDGQCEFRDDDSLKLGIGTGVVEIELIAGVEVVVGSDVAIDVEEVVFEDDLSTLQLPLSQTYPCGQHSLPHFERGSDSLVVLTTLDGSTNTFCRCRSQVIGLMVVQSFPSGQQIRVLESSTLMHVDDFGQQKLDGSFESGHLEYFGSAHESVSLDDSSKASPRTETERAVIKSDWSAQTIVKVDRRISRAGPQILGNSKILK